jgi:hypothetical protein
MAFSPSKLSRLARTNSFDLWRYRTGQDALSVVTAPGFFDPARRKLDAGDMIVIDARDGTAVRGVAGGSGSPVRMSMV